jgi:hypothetical protein
MPDQSPQPSPGKWTLRCPVCNRAVNVELKDTLKFLDEGFPVCCNRVMLLSFEPTQMIRR